MEGERDLRLRGGALWVSWIFSENGGEEQFDCVAELICNCDTKVVYLQKGSILSKFGLSRRGCRREVLQSAGIYLAFCNIFGGRARKRVAGFMRGRNYLLEILLVRELQFGLPGDIDVVALQFAPKRGRIDLQVARCDRAISIGLQ